MTGVRDQIAGEAFLRDRLAILEESMERREGNPKLFGLLVDDQFDRVRVLYSLGAPLDELAVLFRKACEDALVSGKQFGSPATSYPTIGMLRLFGEDDLRVQMTPLLRGREQTARRPVDFLLGFEGLDDDSNYPTPGGGAAHMPTWWLIEQAHVDPVAAEPMLETFVRDEWFQMNKGQPGFDSHHDSSRGRYGGYWCYEAAAIASMFGIDDSELEGHKHYPYDLAHYLYR